MEIRRLRPEDRIHADVVSTVAFHGRIDNYDERNNEYLNDKEWNNEDWGAFDDDGTLMARVINNHFTAYIDGNTVSNGGIGAVSTLPEYRNSGAVRKIMEAILNEAYNRGEVISTLFPFKHSFYRKFGYETVNISNEFTFSPSDLKGFRHEGWAKIYREGDDCSEYDRIYADFSKNHNLMLKRSGSEKVNGVHYRDRKFCYLLGEKGKEAESFVVFQDVRHDPQAIIRIEEAAWTTAEGFRMLLGFLSRFSADYGRIEWKMPTGIDLNLILAEAYDVTKNPCIGYMIRAVNARALLAAMKKRGTFTIRVTDNIIEANNGTWKVSDAVEPFDGTPDLTVTAGQLGQLVSGAVTLDEALLSGAVMTSNGDVLRDTFIKKSTHITNGF